MKAYQLTEEDIRGTLEDSDIGKWVVVLNGCLVGFWDNVKDIPDVYNTLNYHYEHWMD